MSDVILDDRDPSIVYSSGWAQGGVSGEFNSTTTYTDTAGATATITFHGVSITVLGTLGANNTNQTSPQSQYQLDSNKPAIYQPTLTSSTLRNQRFFQSPEVVQGQHTLVMTNLINGSSILALDYFIIVPGSTTSSATLKPTGVSETPNGTTTDQNVPIIAGSVGGVVGCVLLLGVIVYYFRKRRKREVEEDVVDSAVVQSAWVDSSRSSHRLTATPYRNTNTTSSSSSRGRSLTLSRKTQPSTSTPSTSNHAPSTVVGSDDLPPKYKP